MTITLMLEKPFFTSKFSHEGMIKRLEEHIKKTINTFFSLKFIPRNIKWLFWIERSSFREKHFQQKEQPEKNPLSQETIWTFGNIQAIVLSLEWEWMTRSWRTEHSSPVVQFLVAVCKVLGV